MEVETTCNTATLEVYSPSDANPWDMQKVAHLYRRADFGATPEMIKEALQKTPEQVVNQIITEASNTTTTPAPAWGYWYKTEMEANGVKNSVAINQTWKDQMTTDFLEGNLRDRLTLFWSNHFVTQSTQYVGAANAFQYYNLLQRHSIGNFKEFTAEIGLGKAMLEYLNGNENKKESPNENYARELYELFTLGVDNGYTQDDITETSRALTGYNSQPEAWGPYVFNEEDFDNNEKTIFGQTGNWGYDDVINILFEQHPDKIAIFICGKLYQYFVDHEINEIIVKELADIFLANDFEIAPVLSRLFKSEHFFDSSTFGVLIKSPIDLMIPFVKELELEYSSFPIITRIKYASEDLGQNLLDPIDVKGWRRDTSWIASNTLIARWDYLELFLRQAWVSNKTVFQKFAVNIMGGDQASNYNDPDLISKTIVDHLLPNSFTDNATEYEEALISFKRKIPENYFDDGSWNLSWEDEVIDQVYDLLLFTINLPEFQLK